MFDRYDDEAREAAESRAEAAAFEAEYRWRDEHLTMLDTVLHALGPIEVLKHVADFLGRPPKVDVVLGDQEPF